jgi:hypothetical protein
MFKKIALMSHTKNDGNCLDFIYKELVNIINFFSGKKGRINKNGAQMTVVVC